MAEFFIVPTSPQEEGGDHGHQPAISPWSPLLAPSHPRPRTPNAAAALSCRRQAKLVRSRMGERREAPVVSHQHHCIDGGCRSLPVAQPRWAQAAFGARGGVVSDEDLALEIDRR